MKKWLLLLPVGFLFFSCGSVKPYDDSLPPAQTATVVFYRFTPDGYNGIDLDAKKLEVGKDKDKRHYDACISFPAGECEFSGDFKWFGGRPGDNSTIYQFQLNGVSFSCVLEAGEDYFVDPIYQEIEGGEELVWGMKLYKKKFSPAANWLMNNPSNLVTDYIFCPFDPPVITDSFLKGEAKKMVLE
jgi:hypothetical protein